MSLTLKLWWLIRTWALISIRKSIWRSQETSRPSTPSSNSGCFLQWTCLKIKRESIWEMSQFKIIKITSVSWNRPPRKTGHIPQTMSLKSKSLWISARIILIKPFIKWNIKKISLQKNPACISPATKTSTTRSNQASKVEKVPSTILPKAVYPTPFHKLALVTNSLNPNQLTSYPRTCRVPTQTSRFSFKTPTSLTIFQ